MFTADLTQIPENIYEIICSRLPVELMNLNGAEYSQFFPPYLSSLNSLIGQHLRLGGKNIYGSFPRHQFLLKGVPPFILPPIQQAYEHYDSIALTSFFSEYSSRAMELAGYLESDKPGTLRDLVAQEFDTLGQLSSTVRQMSWLNPNINQQHRAAQQAFVDDGLIDRLDYASGLLTEYCLKHQLVWSIRPPIAFHSYAASSLYERSEMSALHDPTWNLSPAMQYVLAATPKFLQDRLYPLTHPYFEYLAQFRFWEHRASYGSIWNEDYELSIIPRSTPSAIYARFDGGIPFYTSVIPGLSPYDSLARVKFADPDAEHLYDSIYSESGALALAVLNYICIGYSIFVATIPMGKGNHKPAWTNSPLNTSLIRATHAIQQPLLERFRRAL